MSVLDGALVFVDIETNGLNHVRGRVIEVAAIRVENGVITRQFSQLVDPETELPQFITNLTGISGRDLKTAPTFRDIADELHEVMDGAVFVAHNVRFDYSFLKQEFKRLGREFSPKQLCTVRLSRALYPEHRSHKLQSLIERHSLQVTARHRAFDDADALRQFVQIVRRDFAPELLDAALSKQLRRPSVPKGLDAAILEGLPEGPGVYIFEDEAGRPLYIGKSVHIKQRVASHFSRDHAAVGEFKIAQAVKRITTHETSGELEALLLESQLIKEIQPLHNKRLRRLSKLLLARQASDDNGYLTVQLEEAADIAPEDAQSLLAVYPTRSKARDSLQTLIKEWSLCPKLCGLEKAKGACFLKQLRKCRGACLGDEAPEAYNARLLEAFARRRVEAWPFNGAVLLEEKTIRPNNEDDAAVHGIVVDQWCVMAHVHREAYCEPVVKHLPSVFDLDTYKILHSYIHAKAAKLRIRPLTPGQLAQLSAA
jgi:DNA polymerase III subunit epsilon